MEIRKFLVGMSCLLTTCIVNFTPMSEAHASSGQAVLGVAAAQNGQLAYTYDGASFSAVAISGAWTGTAFGNGTWVAVGNQVAATSSDGVSWSRQTTSANFYSISFGNGIFVAVGPGVVGTSTDGTTWSTYVKDGEWLSVRFGGGQFVAMAWDKSAVVSTDGTNWTSTNLPTQYEEAAYGNGYWVAVAHSGAISKSQDGLNWSEVFQRSTVWRNVSFGSGLFVAGSEHGEVATSSDGVNWIVPIDAPGGRMWLAVGFVGRQFLALSTLGELATSLDGSSWSTISLSGTWRGIGTRQLGNNQPSQVPPISPLPNLGYGSAGLGIDAAGNIYSAGAGFAGGAYPKGADCLMKFSPGGARECIYARTGFNVFPDGTIILSGKSSNGKDDSNTYVMRNGEVSLYAAGVEGSGLFSPYAFSLSGDLFMGNCNLGKICRVMDGVASVVYNGSGDFRAAATASNGEILFTDCANNRVIALDPDTLQTRVFAASVNYPQGIAVDGAGNVWVGASSSNQILKFSSDGKVLQIFGGVTNSNEVVVSNSGHVYVSLWFGGIVDLGLVAVGPLAIQSPPRKGPTAPTVNTPTSPGPGQLTWTWSSPNAGGSPITSYTWSGACSGSGNVNTVTCSGLTGGTNY